jgi:hypothetical protein
MQDIAHALSDDQLQADFETLAGIVAGLDRLEALWLDTRRNVHARSRGYFTPDEDDSVRQMLLSYRNYRIALYEIIHRSLQYRSITDEAVKLQTFMVGFAAGLTLYSKSLQLIHTYEREPLIRAKLNEPEAKFGIGADFFEEILRAYSSPRNYWLLVQGSLFWRKHRKTVRQLGLLEQANAKWLVNVIRRQRKSIPGQLFQVLARRARCDWRLFWQTVFSPVKRSGYALKSAVGAAFAGAVVTFHYTPALTSDLIGQLRVLLRPGDLLLVRADEKLTAALLPGFWSHAAIYLGTRFDLNALGIPLDARTSDILNNAPEDQPLVIEAVAPKLTISPLAKSLYGDHVVAFRPNLSGDVLNQALTEAFSHLSKPYDFEFDFNVTNRIVCTELVYRSFHKRGGIEFKLVKRLGRFTLTGNDIVHYALDSLAGGAAMLTPVALVLKRDGKGTMIPLQGIVPALQAIRAGATPDEISLQIEEPAGPGLPELKSRGGAKTLDE